MIEDNPMLLLGNDSLALATHAASIQLATDSADGYITLGAPSLRPPIGLGEVRSSAQPSA
eukprot:scaffold28352_cov34-Tisochrysis_lutea.AAC.4